MINYILAKKLKEAGFPQEPRIKLPNSLGEGSMFGGFYWIYPSSGGCGGLTFLYKEDWEKESKKEGWDCIKTPTLEELIQSISQFSFNFLSVGRNFNIEGHWLHDYGYEAKLCIIENLEPGIEKNYKSWELTPEAAVANLWLELNHLKNPYGYIWCSKHKIGHKDFCPEHLQEERKKAG